MPRKLLVVLPMLLYVFGCGDHDPTKVAQPPTLLCDPCDARGPQIAVQTTRPVPFAVIDYWHLCFEAGDDRRCWYDCPDDQTAHGDEACHE